MFKNQEADLVTERKSQFWSQSPTRGRVLVDDLKQMVECLHRHFLARIVQLVEQQASFSGTIVNSFNTYFFSTELPPTSGTLP